MTEYNWIEKYSVGVEELDKQHQQFFEIANSVIHMSGEENIDTGSLLVKIKELNDYSDYHFKAEEEIFKKYNYSGADEHIKEHDAYRAKMKDFLEKAGGAETDTKKEAIEAAEFAGSWLINHIMNTDQKYIEFMKENGIK